MKIRITTGGIFGASGEVPIGTEFDVSAVPAGWAGRYVVISEGPAPGSVPITNELPGLTGKNKAELLEIAKAENVEVEEGATNADIVSAIELAREAAAQA